MSDRESRKEAIRKKALQSLSPQRRQQIVDSMVGASLPDLDGDVEVDVSQMSPAMRQGLLGRLAYDLTRRFMKK